MLQTYFDVMDIDKDWCIISAIIICESEGDWRKERTEEKNENPKILRKEGEWMVLNSPAPFGCQSWVMLISRSLFAGFDVIPKLILTSFPCCTYQLPEYADDVIF